MSGIPCGANVSSFGLFGTISVKKWRIDEHLYLQVVQIHSKQTHTIHVYYGIYIYRHLFDVDGFHVGMDVPYMDCFGSELLKPPWHAR